MNRAQNRGTTVIATANEANSDIAHRQCQRREQVAAYAVQKCHRKEYDHGGKRRREDGQCDLAPAALGSDHGRFSHFQVPVNVFKHDH